MKLRKLTESDVTFTVECLPEDLEIYGNAMASGDDTYDREVADEIQKDLESGNPWAWCCVKVTATWKGFKGDAYLGGCSYESEEDFTQANSDYFGSMKDEALADLNESIARIATSLPLEEGST